MSGFLLDTNVVSKVRKRERVDSNRRVSRSPIIADDEFWLSVLVVGELRRGVELIRRRDPAAGQIDASSVPSASSKSSPTASCDTPQPFEPL